ncbi:AAA family ATPase [Plantibacter sp. Mn2098]|uniref:AAA family ATPase n=1 Tax=Plantibacter sp. Mn2098 TaxID=3395266 RepID=UPI003BE2B858
MSASRILLGVDQPMEADILTRMLEDGHRVVGRCIDAEAVISALAQSACGQIDRVVVSGGERHVTAALVEEARRYGARLLIVSDGEAEAGRVAALCAGAGADAVDVLPLSAGLEALGAAMRRGETMQAAARPPGTVLAVWHASGSPGATTIAVNLAAEFASSGRRVVLADADTYAASIAPMLGLLDEAPGFAAACRLAASGALDAGQLERISVIHAAATGAFRVLTGIARSSRWPELTGERVEATLLACRAWADVVIVDTGCCIEADEEISSDFFAP